MRRRRDVTLAPAASVAVDVEAVVSGLAVDASDARRTRARAACDVRHARTSIHAERLASFAPLRVASSAHTESEAFVATARERCKRRTKSNITNPE